MLPQGKKEPEIEGSMGTLAESKIDFKQLKFTERMRKEYIERLKVVKEKRMEIEVRSLEKQIKAKMERRLKEKMELKERAKLIQDI